MERLCKGYANDAGYDVLLSQSVYLKPFETKVVDLGIQATPNEGTMYILLPRTSAAKQGLYVAACPIDPDYTGNIHAIVTNLGSEYILYNEGEAFCQLVPIQLANCILKANVKKQGRRTDGAFGSTGRGTK